MKVMAKHVRIISFDEMCLLKGNDIYNMLGNKVQVIFPSSRYNSVISSHIKNWIVDNIHDLCCMQCQLSPFNIYFLSASSREHFLNWINDVNFDIPDFPEIEVRSISKSTEY